MPIFMKIDPTEIVEYKLGMEDGFVYDIPMFGLFSKEECVRSGFTPDFEKDKIPYIDSLEGRMLISEGDWIATGVEGERWPIKPGILKKSYMPVSPAGVEKIKAILDLEKKEWQL